DMIGLIADLENFTGDAEEPGSGIIIESSLDSKRGISATGIIKNGTLRRGMFAVCGGAVAPLRFLMDAEGKMAEELSFSSPVRLIGWDKLPAIGSEFRTFLRREDALAYAEQESVPSAAHKAKLPAGVASLPIVIKAD